MPYESYTEKDHAKWRYVLNMNLRFAHEFAHPFYPKCLAELNLSPEKIPTIEELRQKIKHTGWNIVAVNGFITPKTFMEFHAEKFLVVATNIRNLKHINYTPYPDLIHDMVGHIPCVFYEEYADIMTYFGKIGTKAISCKLDFEIHEALNLLSILKEERNPDEKKIRETENLINSKRNSEKELSEMEKVRILHWHTVEYGLMGTVEKPIVYGAGLLSSIVESYQGLTKKVNKKAFNLDAFFSEFDITSHQKELRVVKDFKTIKEITNQFVSKLSLNIGGSHGLKELIKSEEVGTLELNSGIQISGIFVESFISDERVDFIETENKTVFAKENKELLTQNKFASPIGEISEFKIDNEEISFSNLSEFQLILNKEIEIKYKSGIKVSGKIDSYLFENNTLYLLILKKCNIEIKGETIFHEQNILAFGKKITSAYSGVADKNSFEEFEDPVFFDFTISPTKKEKILFHYYGEIRKMRACKVLNIDILKDTFNFSIENFPEDWLIILEVYELIFDSNSTFETIVKNHLMKMRKNEELKTLIDKGIQLIKEKIEIKN